MSDNIRVLIVDDLSETRENVRKLLQFETDIEVIGQAGTGEEAVVMAQEFQPDIILMDINMPGIDGIGASQKISELVPSAQIIIMSVQSDPNYLRRAMMAGARDFLTKPFGGDELVAAIRRVYSKPRPRARAAAPAVAKGTAAPDEVASAGNVLAVFSPKGGAGCTTVAVNLAVALANRKYRTVLVDGSLQFGDVEVMLHMKPMTSLVDVSDPNTELDSDLISTVVQLHKTGVNVLLAPPRPEMAEVVNDAGIKRVLEALRSSYDFIIVDTSSYLTEVTLAILDAADRIALVSQQSLPSLKSIKRFLDLSESLDYAPNKAWLVINRASKQGIPIKNISDALKRPIIATIPDDIIANAAADKGVPVVTGANKKRPISLAILEFADQIVAQMANGKTADTKKEPEEKAKVGFFGRLFGRGARA